jgi:hypothetical protein
MPGPARPWNNVPDDPFIQGATRDFLNWLLTVAIQIQGNLFPPAAPQVTTISQPGAVQVIFNEVANANHYAVFESGVASAPPGVPLSTISANHGAISNSYLRTGLNDTVTRYYFVQAFDNSGNRGTLSSGTPGAALSTAATIVPISQTPVNQGGVGGGVGGGGALPGRPGPRGTQVA